MAKKAKPVETQEPVSSVISSIRQIAITIRGLPPGLLMSGKGGMIPEEDRGKQKGNMPGKEEKARTSAYWLDEEQTQLALPWENLYKSIVEAAKQFRFNKRPASKIVAASISCEQQLIPLGTKRYEIDARWGRIPPKTGGVVMLYRARVPNWAASFVMMVDDEFCNLDVLPKILKTAGKLVGVCANRPALFGSFGKFVVEQFEIIA